MEELASAIVDGINLVKLLFADASAAEGNTIAIDQESLMDGISSIVQNIAAFVTELTGLIVTKL
jgi:hypothetical protein